MLLYKDIVKEGDPVLRQVANEVPLPISEQDKETLRLMMEYVVNSQDDELAEKYELRPGVGLAAPQIGVSKRMFVVHFHDEDDQLISYGIVNPKILSHSVEKIHLEDGEGCLSVDRPVPGIVPRYARIRLKAFDMAGNEIELKLKGYSAIVFQHELDHLDGVMFYDRITNNDEESRSI